MSPSTAQVLFTIGKTCSSCQRGALASRPFETGDVIARVPASATLAVGPGPLHEEALKLLTRRHTDPSFNQTFAAFLSALPSLDDMLAPASLAPAELAELQMPELVSAQGRRLQAVPARRALLLWLQLPPYCMRCAAAAHATAPGPSILLPARTQERLLLNQQREITAAFNQSKAGSPPWLTLQQLHHMTALVREASRHSTWPAPLAARPQRSHCRPMAMHCC